MIHTMLRGIDRASRMQAKAPEPISNEALFTSGARQCKIYDNSMLMSITCGRLLYSHDENELRQMARHLLPFDSMLRFANVF